MNNGEFTAIMNCTVRELVDAMYGDLICNGADEEDDATLNFGNKKFKASLIVKLNNGERL